MAAPISARSVTRTDSWSVAWSPWASEVVKDVDQGAALRLLGGGQLAQQEQGPTPSLSFTCSGSTQ